MTAMAKVTMMAMAIAKQRKERRETAHQGEASWMEVLAKKKRRRRRRRKLKGRRAENTPRRVRLWWRWEWWRRRRRAGKWCRGHCWVCWPWIWQQRSCPF